MGKSCDVNVSELYMGFEYECASAMQHHPGTAADGETDIDMFFSKKGSEMLWGIELRLPAMTKKEIFLGDTPKEIIEEVSELIRRQTVRADTADRFIKEAKAMSGRIIVGSCIYG